jgi:uncharacterized membrane protein YbhN (UPF0104 family)
MTKGSDTIMPEKTSSTKQRVIRGLIVVAVLVFVFGWLLPQFIDYELIWDALTSMTWQDLLVLSVLAIVRVPTEAMVYRAMLPGLSLRVGSEAYLSSNVAANVMPPGASSVVQYAYFRTAGFDNQSSSTGALGTFVFPQGARLALPIVAFIVLLGVDGVDDEALIITGISVALVAIVSVLIWLVGRSEKSARWVGAKLGQFVSWILVKFKKDPVGDLGDQVVDFRDNAYRIVAKRWPFGTVAVALNLALTYLILVASLRAVGVEQSQLGLAVTFAAFAVAFFAGVVIPITGSGLGVVDVVMVSALSASTTGDVDVNVIVAAVVLWRLFYGLLAFFPGILTLTRFAKQHRDLLTDAGAAFGGDAAGSGDAEPDSIPDGDASQDTFTDDDDRLDPSVEGDTNP